MLENYRFDMISGAFSSEDLSTGKYAKLFSVKKGHNVQLVFTLLQIAQNVSLISKRVAFISGATPNLYDFDIDSSGITLKVFDDGSNYVLYGKISNRATINLKIEQCDTPNLIKFYHREVPVTLPTSGDITNKSSINKISTYFSILSLIKFDWNKQFGTQLLIQDGNEISGHLFVKGNQTGDGSQICTMPAPLYISSESLFQTFCAMYQGTDNLWYGCTLRLDSNGVLKMYDVGANAPSYIAIKANIHYRCSSSVINQFLK